MKLTILYFSDVVNHVFGNKAILLFGFTLAPFINSMSDMMNIKFLGFSMGILTFLSLLLLFDFITGIIASKYEGSKLTSAKGLRSVHKFISYFMFLCFAALLQGQLEDNGYTLSTWLISNIRILIFSLIFLWEWHSIGENLERRFGNKPRLFTFLDIITKILENKIITKIEKSKHCNTTKNSDSKNEK